MTIITNRQIVWLPLVILAVCGISHAAESPNMAEAIAWYDTLGYPNAAGLRYVRVATGRTVRQDNQPPQNTYVEGFLVREDNATFTVFLCNVSEFRTRFADLEDFPSQPYWPMTTVQFERRSGAEYQQVGYEVLDFRSVAYAVLDRVRAQPVAPALLDSFMVPATQRVRIFAFARACLQQGVPDVAVALMDIAAEIPTGQTGRVEPAKFLSLLQHQIGDAVLAQAERDAANPAISWRDLLSEYTDFDLRFPASDRISYANGEAGVLREMIVQEAEHSPKPVGQMSPSELAAEEIYQLRNSQLLWWRTDRYPAESADGRNANTVVQQLIDLGNNAVPQLIEALDDHSLTKSTMPSFNGTELPRDMRVSDCAQRILEFMSGKSFFPRGTSTTRRQAEAWWAGVNATDDK